MKGGYTVACLVPCSDLSFLAHDVFRAVVPPVYSVAMPNYTAKEVEQRYVDEMGPELGRTFYRLFNECAWLYFNWRHYVVLFGKNESRIDLLNQAAPIFFRRVQDALWEEALLHVCRLTDRPKVAGKLTLTIQRLPLLVDPMFRPEVEKVLRATLEKCQFARDWRNRHIGHHDLSLALDDGAEPLAVASRQHMTEALQGIAAVLNLVEGHYCDGSPTYYDFESHSDAESLLYVLRDGLEAREEEIRRLKSGHLRPEDILRKPAL